MDYTYLHQAAAVAQFDTSSVAGSTNNIQPPGKIAVFTYFIKRLKLSQSLKR